MSYRQEHPVLFTLGSVFCICVALVAGIFAAGHFGTKQAEINAEKEKAISEIHEREETERTEEKAQFWQKLIPWGNDEQETSQ